MNIWVIPTLEWKLNFYILRRETVLCHLNCVLLSWFIQCISIGNPYYSISHAVTKNVTNKPDSMSNYYKHTILGSSTRADSKFAYHQYYIVTRKTYPLRLCTHEWRVMLPTFPDVIHHSTWRLHLDSWQRGWNTKTRSKTYSILEKTRFDSDCWITVKGGTPPPRERGRIPVKRWRRVWQTRGAEYLTWRGLFDTGVSWQRGGGRILPGHE